MNSSDRRYDQNAREPLPPLLTDQQSNFLRFIVERYRAGFRSSFVVMTKPRGTAEDSIMRYADGNWIPVTIDALDLDHLAQMGYITMRVLQPSIHRVMPTALGIQVGITLDSRPLDLETDAETDVDTGLIVPSTSDDQAAWNNYREKLLAGYMDDTGVSEHAIYACAGKRTHSCHKPEFYKWKRGELPPTSQSAISLETFLTARRLPPDKQSKSS